MKNADGKYEFKGSAKVSGAPIAISAVNGKQVFVLLNSNKLSVIDYDTFTVASEIDLKDYEATAMTSTNDEIWIGDKKGMIHVLGLDFSQKALIEKKHNHSVTVM
jgi:hypothetical protein